MILRRAFSHLCQQRLNESWVVSGISDYEECVKYFMVGVWEVGNNCLMDVVDCVEK